MKKTRKLKQKNTTDPIDFQLTPGKHLHQGKVYAKKTIMQTTNRQFVSFQPVSLWVSASRFAGLLLSLLLLRPLAQ